jgi:hypothetical protein
VKDLKTTDGYREGNQKKDERLVARIKDFAAMSNL